MKKLKTRDSIGWLFRFIILIEIIIIILILLRSYNKKMIIFNGNGANSGSMKNIIAYSDEKVEIKENKFTKDGYNFDGWNLYNDKDSTWKCEEGWFSEKEIEENNYKVLFYSTEDINDYFNLMNKGKVTAVAKWSKSSDVTEENPVSTTEEIANIETKTEEIKVEKSNNVKTKVEETKEESKVEETKCINHSYEVKITKKASCSENGTKTYTCSKCKDTYTEAIPKLEHEYELKIKKAGCEEDGAKIYTCINCQDTYQEIIPMTGHNYETYVYKNPTCSQIGILVHKCIVCEKIITENIPKLEHNYEEKIIKEATIKEEGLKKFICKECNSSYEEEIPKLIPTDLDILKENLIGAILDGTEMGKEETIGEVTIRFDGKILFEGEGTENFKIYNKIEYNGNEYSIIVDGNTGTIIDVKNKEEEKFKFGEPYTSINQSEAYTYTIEKNGDFVGYEDRKYMGEEKEFIIIYENKVYIKYEDNMYTITGEVKEDGNKVIITSDNEIIELIYDPDFKAIEDKPNEGGVGKEYIREELEKLTKGKSIFNILQGEIDGVVVKSMSTDVIVEYRGEIFQLVFDMSTYEVSNVLDSNWREFGDENNYFTISKSGNNVTITGLTEFGKKDLLTNKILKIPAKILGTDGIEYTVTKIKKDAFTSDETIKKSVEKLEFELGISIETIEEYCFSGMSNLTGNVNIPASVRTIGGFAFNQTKITSLSFEKNSSLQSIGEFAFSLESLGGNLIIPASVKTIGRCAFWNAKITSLTFEKNSQLKTIMNSAFSDCIELTGTIEIPASCQTIEYAAFWGCSKITGLKFNNAIELKESSFANCSSLTGELYLYDGTNCHCSWINCSNGKIKKLSISPEVYTYGNASGTFYFHDDRENELIIECRGTSEQWKEKGELQVDTGIIESDIKIKTDDGEYTLSEFIKLIKGW